MPKQTIDSLRNSISTFKLGQTPPSWFFFSLGANGQLHRLPLHQCKVKLVWFCPLNTSAVRWCISSATRMNCQLSSKGQLWCLLDKHHSNLDLGLQRRELVWENATWNDANHHVPSMILQGHWDYRVTEISFMHSKTFTHSLRKVYA